MSDQNRQPAGVPTGGQFAASQHTESEVSLDPTCSRGGCGERAYCAEAGECLAERIEPVCGNCGTPTPWDELSANDECDQCDAETLAAIEAENDDPGADDNGDAEVLFEFQAPGSSSYFEVAALQSDEDDQEYEVWRDNVYVGSFQHLGDPQDHHEIESMALDYLRSTGAIPAEDPRAAAIAKIENPEWREACEDYLTRYAPSPDTADFEPDWAQQVQKNARNIAVGDRLVTNQIVTHVAQRNGEVYVHTDGRDPGGKATGIFNHGDPVVVHADRVDLSDPDWYEVEAQRAWDERVSYEEAMTNDDSYVMPTSDRLALRDQIRRGMYRSFSATDISPLRNEGANVDPRWANGRAKIGDNVMTDSPMHGSTAYRVLGKRAYVAITGADENGVTRAENGEVEYVIENVETGRQETSFLRGVMWKRIPAPGDTGPGAVAQSLQQRS